MFFFLIYKMGDWSLNNSLFREISSTTKLADWIEENSVSKWKLILAA